MTTFIKLCILVSDEYTRLILSFLACTKVELQDLTVCKLRFWKTQLQGTRQSLCVCVCVCLCVCVCFCTITQKEIDLGTRNRNTLQYMKIARTSSILSFIGSRSRSLQAFKNFPHLPQYKLSGPIVQLWYKLGTLY